MTPGNFRRGALVVLLGLALACLACSAEDPPSSDGRQTSVLPPTTATQPGASGAPVASQAGTGGASLPPPVVPPPGTGGSTAVGGSGAAGQTALAGAGAGGAGGAGGMAGAAGMSGAAAPPITGDVCARWNADRANLSEGTWSGSAASCEAGDMTPEARATAHKLVNLYRFMAGLEPVEMTEEGNARAQACALLMQANGTLSHSPPASWDCYTEEAADAAGSSSLSPDGAVASVDGYMVDPGNPTTLGHRRWVLSNMLAGVAFGSTGEFSCQYQPPRRPPSGAKPWVAWPSPGQVPIQALGTRWASIDSTGWSVQSDSVALGSADVTITEGGMELPVTVTALNPGYGSTHAISIIPSGWKVAAGKTYHVALSGTSTPIEYDVEIVDCQ